MLGNDIFATVQQFNIRGIVPGPNIVACDCATMKTYQEFQLIPHRMGYVNDWSGW
jgi:hypothetical protein